MSSQVSFLGKINEREFNLFDKLHHVSDFHPLKFSRVRRSCIQEEINKMARMELRYIRESLNREFCDHHDGEIARNFDGKVRLRL